MLSSPSSGTHNNSYSTDGDETVSDLVAARKPAILHRLMTKFYSMLDPSTGIVIRNGTKSSSSQRAGESGSTSGSQSSGSYGFKPKPSKGGFSGRNTDEQDNSDKPQKPPENHLEDELGNSRKLACPYFKRNPRKYQKFRSCPGPGWDTVHRLKEHLYRRHALPLRCPRCYQPFQNDAALNEHHRARQGCEVREEDPTEGFDKEQENKLKSRKRRQPDRSEEDRWRHVYRILFPDDIPSAMPSPCKFYLYIKGWLVLRNPKTMNIVFLPTMRARV
ncbi:hypothetical protein K432DRAFT_355440 [Lepidopterella palustris CBS 459.81]|uniref:C2H2-type domain-containing protein n=1 Tax=Lepidopterella palustris CBS 459.81 TaxID=1314670 RepID=A0A8E2E8T7_9PEZI|nr:hypothetical protein K432DRAFT_355440 [Lepidopterella palustris CBS 459.81]